MIHVALPLEDDYSDIVRKARYGLGLGLEQLADAVGMSSQRLQAMESGSVQPSYEEAQRLAHSLNLHGNALWEIVNGWGPDEAISVKPFHVQTFRFSKMASNGYVVTGGGIRSALLIDPGDRPQELISACEHAGGLDAILLTHTHFDHVDALPEVVRRYPQVPVVVHMIGADSLPQAAHLHTVSSDTSVQLGGVQIDIWEAPGHSEDGLLISLGCLVFTGDTLFAGSLGRSAQGPATYGTLLNSAQRLLALAPDTRLLPGHGPITTAALEARHNPFLA